jgi:hypothetical protein
VQERVRQRFADELTANHAEQEELTSQITALQQRLDQLRADEAWLTQAQSSLPTTGEPAEGTSGSAAETPSTAPAEPAETSAPADAEAPQTVPAQRQKQTARKTVRGKKPAATKSAAQKPAAKSAAAKKPTTEKAAAKAPVKKSAAKKTAPATEKPAANKPAAEQAPAPKATTVKAASPKPTTAKAPAAKATAGGPPLWELLLGVLRKTPGQPLVAREVSEQLAKDHPDRATSAQTVRNGLQTLVSKNLAEKTRQQGNVMYTAHTDAPAAPSPAGDEPASGEEQAAEKVPAKVS